MPNTLVHFGVQTLATRAVRRDVDPRWILAACLIPDVPWILLRIAHALPLRIDPYAVELYGLTQATLLVSLILAAALAVLSGRPRALFPLLAANVVLHLLLDACEIKWGNGVVLLAPFSWWMLQFGWVWPESATITALTLGGLAVTLLATRRALDLPQPALSPLTPRRALAVAVLVAAWLGAPLLLMPRAYADDVRSIRTQREAQRRPGRPIALDRVPFRRFDGRATIETLGGEALSAAGALPETSGLVSIRGAFRDADTIEIARAHTHHGWLRDVPSYLALGLFAVAWAGPWLRRRGG